MGIFLAYLLAVACISLGFMALRWNTDGQWLPTLIVNWLMICTYLALGVGLLWAVWRKVKAW